MIPKFYLQASRAGHLKEIHIRVLLLLYNILWTFTRKVYFVLGQNGPWQNIMHIYVYEDDEEQGALSKPGHTRGALLQALAGLGSH